MATSLDVSGSARLLHCISVLMHTAYALALLGLRWACIVDVSCVVSPVLRSWWWYRMLAKLSSRGEALCQASALVLARSRLCKSDHLQGFGMDMPGHVTCKESVRALPMLLRQRQRHCWHMMQPRMACSATYSHSSRITNESGWCITKSQMTETCSAGCRTAVTCSSRTDAWSGIDRLQACFRSGSSAFTC